jgi:hypothetical protein
VVLNVTAVNPATSGFLTVFPTGSIQPTTSNINYVAGNVVPNLVEVGTGTSGDVSIFSSAQTDLVVDMEGYTSAAAPAGAGAGLYNALSFPARICDTRSGNPSNLDATPDNQCNGTGNRGERLNAGSTLAVKVVGANGVPIGATAAVLNVTAVTPSTAGFLTVYPQGTARPFASNVNYTLGKTTANRVIAPLSNSGQITVYSSAPVDVVIDVSGYFSAAGGAGTEFNSEATPVRICDTRAGNPSDLIGSDNQCEAETIPAGGNRTINVAGLAGVPATGATAVVVNLTGIDPTQQTFLTVFPALPRPFASDLNPAPGMVRANLVVATLSPTGTINIYNNSGSIDVVVDVLGWYS